MKSVALSLAGKLARRLVARGARQAAKVATRAGESGFDTLVERAHRLPIQRSVDIAVPIEVAWEQWSELGHLPEGAVRVTEVERDGETLSGQIEGPPQREWEAEVIDERPCESFAWRSTKGSDSAGLVTFHELSERLTRIELNLDVRPTGVVQAATLALRLADLRAEAELRRLKADAELLNPDIYEELLSSNGGGRQSDEEERD